MTHLIDKFADFVVKNKALSVLTGLWLCFTWGTVENVLAGSDSTQDLVIVILVGPALYLGVLARDAFLDCLTKLSEARRLNKPPRT